MSDVEGKQTPTDAELPSISHLGWFSKPEKTADVPPAEQPPKTDAKPKREGKIKADDEVEVEQAHTTAARDSTVEDQEKTEEQLAKDARKAKRKKLIWYGVLTGVLLLLWAFCTYELIAEPDKERHEVFVSIPVNSVEYYLIPSKQQGDLLGVNIKGTFQGEGFGTKPEPTADSPFAILTIDIEREHMHDNGQIYEAEIASKAWHIEILPLSKTIIKLHKALELTQSDNPHPNDRLRVRMVTTNYEKTLGMSIRVNSRPIDKKTSYIYAVLLLVFLYVLLIWEILSATFTAVLAATAAVSILAMLGNRPGLHDLLSWIDGETLLFLFSMMIIVGVIAKTGIFDYISVLLFKFTKGRVWPTVTCIFLFTATLSTVLDNVTMVLLIMPIIIRICQILDLNVQKIVISMAIFTNIGGCMTAVGDPPNVLIMSNAQIAAAGVNFFTFLVHTFIPVTLMIAITYVYLRFRFRDFYALRYNETESKLNKLRQSLRIWSNATTYVTPIAKDGDEVHKQMIEKVSFIKSALHAKASETIEQTLTYEERLQYLQELHPIRDRILLIKCSIVIVFLVILFFLNTLPQFKNMTMAWIAFLGAILMLILADDQDLDELVKHIEWSTLIFFTALFIFMEAIVILGLVDIIGKFALYLILNVDKDYQLTVTIFLLIWLTGLLSSFCDNVPITSMMIHFVVRLDNSHELNVPLTVMVWALVFGLSFGGNGSLIAASSNIVGADMAKEYGYKISFGEFFKIGFPVTIVSLIITSIYMYIVHVLLEFP